jgi:hypothetical protein
MAGDIQDSAKKMLEAMQKGKKAPKSGKPAIPEDQDFIDRQASKEQQRSAQSESRSAKAPKRIKTQVDNEQAGPDEDLMNEVEKFAPAKKKAASAPADSDSPPPRPANLKGARKSGSGRAASPAPVAKPTESEISPRHQQLLDEIGPRGSNVPPEMEADPFEQLNRDLPRGNGGGGGGGGAPPESVMPGESAPSPRISPRNALGGHPMEGPMTVAAIAAQLALSSMPNGERSDVPGGSIEANDESKMRQMQDTGIPSSHREAGYAPSFNPVATEVGNRAALPSQVKQPSGVNGAFRVPPGSAKDQLDHIQAQKDSRDAQAFAEELRRNYPDQIAK